MRIAIDNLKNLPPEEILGILLDELECHSIKPAIARFIANRLFLKNHIDVDGHGIIMNGLHKRRK